MPPVIVAMLSMLIFNAEVKQPKPKPVPAHDDYVAFAVAHLEYKGLQDSKIQSEWQGKI